MPCDQPVIAYKKLPELGGGVTFFRKESMADFEPLRLACRQCLGCRMDRARDWATRMHHEAQMHFENCFLTLTYSKEHLPEDYSVNVRHVQLFLKRYRKRVGIPIRFFACGEYGGENNRPHYHLLIFGHDFHDKYFWRVSKSGYRLYRSPLLEEIWTLGSSEIGTVTHQSAGYTARYVCKKVTGDAMASHYTRVHPDTGQVVNVTPEFITMSRKPGLGGSWFDDFRRDAFPSDFLIIDGRKVPVPAFYLKQLEKVDPEMHRQIKIKRRRNAQKDQWSHERGYERRLVKAECRARKYSLLPRELEETS